MYIKHKQNKLSKILVDSIKKFKKLYNCFIFIIKFQKFKDIYRDLM